MASICRQGVCMNKWLTKFYIGVTIGTWIKRIAILMLCLALYKCGDYYVNVHLPMMENGGHVRP